MLLLLKDSELGRASPRIFMWVKTWEREHTLLGSGKNKLIKKIFLVFMEMDFFFERTNQF